MDNSIKMIIKLLQTIHCLAVNNLMIKFKALSILKQANVLTGNH
jgi:hypothetical protein